MRQADESIPRLVGGVGGVGRKGGRRAGRRSRCRLGEPTHPTPTDAASGLHQSTSEQAD